MASYDLLVVGSGLYGAVIAQQAREHGLKCLVLERRHQVGGNIRDEWTEGICVGSSFCLHFAFTLNYLGLPFIPVS